MCTYVRACANSCVLVCARATACTVEFQAGAVLPMPRTEPYLNVLLREHIICFVPENRRKWTLIFQPVELPAGVLALYRAMVDAFLTSGSSDHRPRPAAGVGGCGVFGNFIPLLTPIFACCCGIIFCGSVTHAYICITYFPQCEPLWVNVFASFLVRGINLMEQSCVAGFISQAPHKNTTCAHTCTRITATYSIIMYNMIHHIIYHIIYHIIHHVMNNKHNTQYMCAYIICIKHMFIYVYAFLQNQDCKFMVKLWNWEDGGGASVLGDRQTSYGAGAVCNLS